MCERMTASLAPFARAVRVILVLGLEHVHADHPHVDRRVEQREGQPGQDEVVRPIRGTAAPRGRGDEVAVTADGKSSSFAPK